MHASNMYTLYLINLINSVASLIRYYKPKCSDTTVWFVDTGRIKSNKHADKKSLQHDSKSTRPQGLNFDT